MPSERKEMSGWTPDETGMDDEPDELICPVTEQPCLADMDGWQCEDYGCARRRGLIARPGGR